MEAGASVVAAFGLSGAAMGSFVNVVAHRLPRGQSLVRPRSRCPSCEVQIAGYDNVPVVSWLVLQGRCRSCGAPISARYPLIEAVTALLFAAVAARAGSVGELLSGLVLVGTLVAVAVIDLEHRIVPNRILAPAALAALVIWGLADPSRLPENLVAGVGAGLALFLPALLYPAGMGMGDVKLAAVMGLFLGRSVVPALFVGFALGSVVGLAIVMARGRAARKQTIAFAPYLAAGGIVGQFFGDSMIHWYLGFV
jgi:leader peptidase (prepilin peptidase)/N-methyltransferase